MIQSQFELQIDKLVETTCSVMCVTREDLLSKTRKEECANARFFIAHILKNRITRGDYRLADREVCKVINRDRSTCIHGYQRVEDMIDAKSFWIEKYYQILEELGFDTKEQPRLPKSKRTIDYLRGFIHYTRTGQISPIKTTNNIIKEIKLLKNEETITVGG